MKIYNMYYFVCIAPHPVHPVQYLLLPPATKLRQGYVFTRVCDSVHMGEGFGIPACHGADPPTQTKADTHPRDQGRHPRTKADTPLTRTKADTPTPGAGQ